MSSQLDGHLDLPSSYNFNKDATKRYKATTIDPNNFYAWLKQDMYASSYAKHHSPDSIEPKAGHIPGYAGFIPKDRAESLHAKTFANKTKEVFNDPQINVNRSGLATTGFNITKDALIDKSKLATSHKYGKTEIQTPHPGWIPPQWVSTTKDTYKNPKELGDPTYRQADKNVLANSLRNKTSGYQQNRAYWDGNGWNPNPILNPAKVSSEYRDRFNPERSFHRPTQVDTKPQLKKPQYKYSFNV